jgi:hypothetical protein
MMGNYVQFWVPSDAEATRLTEHLANNTDISHALVFNLKQEDVEPPQVERDLNKEYNV